MVPGYRLSLAYEFHADGAAFVTTFFYTETPTPGELNHFVLEPSITLEKGQDCHWANWRLPERQSAAIIQDLRHFERNLTRKDARHFDRSIAPFISFDFGNNDQRDRHLEFFVESWNSLTQDPANTSTDIQWEGSKATIQWDFEKTAHALNGRPYQWRNIWGWCLRQFPVERHHPPFRIFHYLDNFDRYPKQEVIRQVAEQGANILILHENWRLDLKNGEMPHDLALLKQTSDCCHKHGLRLGLYVRGNEDCIRKSFAEHLRPYLKPNWDGIYMDYGSPMCYTSMEENAPGGRIGFREYHRMSRKIREFVGPDGFHISHSGSFFSAIGYTYVDAYLGGEQEKGALLKDTTVHAYFSGLSIAPSSLWTAAFPTYRTSKVLPFLASTLQAPFLHLGTQFPYSSLSHPRIPSLITFARPLWKLWELFDEIKDIRAYSTQNTQGLFVTDGAETGASMMIAPNGDALVVAANFSDSTRDIHVRLDTQKIPWKPGQFVFALTSNHKQSVFQPVGSIDQLQTQLEGCGVGGWLIVHNPEAWQQKLARFARPYALPTEEEQQTYRQQLAKIKADRFDPPKWEQCYLQVSIPNWPNNYEDSVWFDLFESTVELLDLTNPEKPERIGYISRHGLVPTLPEKQDYIWPGVETPWIPLHSIPCVKAGSPIQLGLATRRGEFEFYTFVKAVISPQPKVCEETRELVYNNDIDLDWSLLTFCMRE